MSGLSARLSSYLLKVTLEGLLQLGNVRLVGITVLIYCFGSFLSRRGFVYE